MKWRKEPPDKPGVNISSSDGTLFLISECDVAEIMRHTWRIENTGPHKTKKYARRTAYSSEAQSHKKTIWLHRVIVGACAGELVDHINGDTLDNRRENLRVVSYAQNGMNRMKGKDCSSLYKGVCWQKNRKTWNASIKINGKSVHLGVFHKEKDAALAYDKAAIENFGQYAKTNFAGPIAEPEDDE